MHTQRADAITIFWGRENSNYETVNVIDIHRNQSDTPEGTEAERTVNALPRNFRTEWQNRLDCLRVSSYTTRPQRRVLRAVER